MADMRSEGDKLYDTYHELTRKLAIPNLAAHLVQANKKALVVVQKRLVKLLFSSIISLPLKVLGKIISFVVDDRFPVLDNETEREERLWLAKMSTVSKSWRLPARRAFYQGVNFLSIYELGYFTAMDPKDKRLSYVKTLQFDFVDNLNLHDFTNPKEAMAGILSMVARMKNLTSIVINCRLGDWESRALPIITQEEKKLESLFLTIEYDEKANKDGTRVSLATLPLRKLEEVYLDIIYENGNSKERYVPGIDFFGYEKRPLLESYSLPNGFSSIVESTLPLFPKLREIKLECYKSPGLLNKLPDNIELFAGGAGIINELASFDNLFFFVETLIVHLASDVTEPIDFSNLQYLDPSVRSLILVGEDYLDLITALESFGIGDLALISLKCYEFDGEDARERVKVQFRKLKALCKKLKIRFIRSPLP